LLWPTSIETLSGLTVRELGRGPSLVQPVITVMASAIAAAALELRITLLYQ
jgi:hypothetical protein